MREGVFSRKIHKKAELRLVNLLKYLLFSCNYATIYIIMRKSVFFLDLILLKIGYITLGGFLTMKKLITFLTAVILSLSAIAFVACQAPTESAGNSAGTSASDSVNDTPETATAYEFTVVDENGAPIVNVGVQLCLGEDSCLHPVFTDANGKATVTPPNGENTYDIHLLGLSSDYTFDNDAHKTPATYGEVTVTVQSAN